MTTETTTPEEDVHRASAHLYEALTHHFGPLDLGAHEPLVLAISEYGQQCRRGDEERIHAASQHIFEAMTHHFRPLDPRRARADHGCDREYGAACRAAGPKA